MANARLRELAPRQKETGFTQLSLHPFLHVCLVQVKFERTRVRRVVANHTLYNEVEHGRREGVVAADAERLVERFYGLEQVSAQCMNLIRIYAHIYSGM